jgi:hypothetical protein
MFVEWKIILSDKTLYYIDTKFPDSLIDWIPHFTQTIWRQWGTWEGGGGVIPPHPATEGRGRQNGGENNCYKRKN